jgi:Tol biopolymer transport system component
VPRMTWVAAALVAASGLTLVGAAPSAVPPPAEGRIAFVSDLAAENVHAALLSVGVDGRGRRRLLADADGIQEVLWSPQGTRLAFVRDGAVFVLSARGGKPRRVAALSQREAESTLAWSPDGTRLAYFDLDSGNTLTVVRVDSRRRPPERRRLAGTVGDVGGHPAWSPDGREIAFIRSRADRYLDLVAVRLADRRVRVLVPRAQGGDPAWSPDGRTIAYSSGVFGTVVVDAAGGRPRRLGNLGTTPSWSPDGRKLAVIRNNIVNVVDVRTGRQVLVSRGFATDLRVVDTPVSWSPDSRRLAVPVFNDVYLVRADGRGKRPVARYDGRADLLTVPVLSPDGRRVAYIANPKVSFDFDLYTVRPDGSDLRALTRDEIGDDQPAWSPDRTQIAYVREVLNDHRIVVVGADGRGAREVAKGDVPAWSPDGRLAYSRGGDIYTLDLAGGGEQLLIGGATLDSDPSWSPDGKRIAFARRDKADAPAEV